MKAIIKSITSLPSDDSSNLDYTTQARVIKGNLYYLDNDISYQKTQHRRLYAEWSMLKEDSTGSEANARAMHQKLASMESIEKQLDNLVELQDGFKDLHTKLLGRDWVKPIKGQKINYSTQEVDSDFEPRKI